MFSAHHCEGISNVIHHHSRVET